MTPIRARSVGLSLLVGASFVVLTSGESRAQTSPPPPGAPPPGAYPPPGAPPPGAYAPPGAYPSTYAPVPMLTAPRPAPRVNSVNGNPLGFLFGSYSLNYERLVNGTHGFIVEGNLAHSTGTTTGTETSSNKSTTYGGGAGYRWHWSGEQNSGFLGLMAGYSVGAGTSTITSGGVSNSFDLTIKAPWVVANIGRRWQWDNGINLTFRIGGGWAKYTVTTSSTDDQAKDAVKFVQDILTLIPIALDGELSLGYTF